MRQNIFKKEVKFIIIIFFYAKVVCKQAKENYNARGFDIFIMNFNRDVFGHVACY